MYVQDVQQKKNDKANADQDQAETWTLLNVSPPPQNQTPPTTVKDGPSTALNTQAGAQTAPGPSPTVQFRMPPEVVYPPSSKLFPVFE